MKAEHRKAVLDKWDNHKIWITFYCRRSLYHFRPKIYRGCKPIYYPRAGMFEDYKTELFCPNCKSKMIQGRDIFLT